jgi:hypothetical protein
MNERMVSTHKVKTVKWWFLGVIVIAIASLVAVEKKHFSTYGHLVPYGWHVDVGTIIPDPQFTTPRPDLKSGGIIVPAEGQWAKILNFTMVPVLVEACMSGNTLVFPLVVEKLDPANGTWTVAPPYRGQTCLNLPIRTKLIWPLESFNTMPVPIAKASFWFKKGDWVRIVALSRCNKPLGEQRKFISPPFQLTEDLMSKSRSQ